MENLFFPVRQECCFLNWSEQVLLDKSYLKELELVMFSMYVSNTLWLILFLSEVIFYQQSWHTSWACLFLVNHCL